MIFRDGVRGVPSEHTLRSARRHVTHVCCAIVVSEAHRGRARARDPCCATFRRRCATALRVTHLAKAVTCVKQVVRDSATIPSHKKAHSVGHSRTAARATCTTTSWVSQVTQARAQHKHTVARETEAHGVAVLLSVARAQLTVSFAPFSFLRSSVCLA